MTQQQVIYEKILYAWVRRPTGAGSSAINPNAIPELAEFINKQMNNYALTKSTVDALRTKRLDTTISYKEEIERIDRFIEEAQKQCLHLEKTFHGDPAGGTDSFYECNVCGKQGRSL